MGTFADLAFKNFVAKYGKDALESVSQRLLPFAQRWYDKGVRDGKQRAEGFPRAPSGPTTGTVQMASWEILRDVLTKFYDSTVVDQAIERFKPGD